MMAWRRNGVRSALPARRWLASLRLPLVATVLGTTLAILSQCTPGSAWHLSTAYACGLGNTPTMLADGKPALLYPVTTNVPVDQPIGIFAMQYVAGQPIKFTEDTSRVQGAPPLSTLKLRWTFGDGAVDTTDVAPSHMFAHAGAFAVHIQIYDPTIASWTDLDSAQIQVIPAALPNPPIARATASTTAVVQSGTITFDAANSQALVGSHLTYLWNFNDASTASGPHVSHQFFLPGQGFVALVVTDDRGARSVATINIAVVGDPHQLPTASLSASATNVRAGVPVSFDASQSAPATQPAGDQIVQYAWDFGDGTPQQTTREPTVSHIFQRAGGYTVAVQAIDQQGTPAQATVQVNVALASTGKRAAPGSSVPPWLLWAGILVALLLAAGGIVYVVRAQQRQAAIERQQQAALELRRARRIPRGGTRPGDPRWGDPRGDGRATRHTESSRQTASQRDARRGPPSAGRS